MHHLTQKLTLTDSEKNKNLVIIPFQSSGIFRVEHGTLLVENYSPNQWQHCLKLDLIKNKRDCLKTKLKFSI